MLPSDPQKAAEHRNELDILEARRLRETNKSTVFEEVMKIFRGAFGVYLYLAASAIFLLGISTWLEYEGDEFKVAVHLIGIVSAILLFFVTRVAWHCYFGKNPDETKKQFQIRKDFDRDTNPHKHNCWFWDEEHKYVGKYLSDHKGYRIYDEHDRLNKVMFYEEKEIKGTVKTISGEVVSHYDPPP